MSTKAFSLVSVFFLCVGLPCALVAANKTAASETEPMVMFPGAAEKPSAQNSTSLKSTFTPPVAQPGATSLLPSNPPAPPPTIPSAEPVPQNPASTKISMTDTVTASSKDLFVDYVVTFKNEGGKPVEITHIGTAPFNLIKLTAPIKLAPKQSATQAMTANTGKLRQGTTLPVFAIEKGSNGNNIIVGQSRINFTDVPNIETPVVMWRTGDPLTEKMISLKLPAGTTAEKVIASPGFTARLDGTSVFVKPTATDSPSAAVIRVKCTPEVRVDLAPMITAVIQK